MSKIRLQEEKQTKTYLRLDDKIARKFSASHMSNTKWVRLLKNVASFDDSYELTNLVEKLMDIAKFPISKTSTGYRVNGYS